MPLTINVGLSRKASENYQSTGFSINLVAELDQALLARPEQLQQQIDQLYHQAETALERQASLQEAPAVGNGGTRSNGHNGNGHTAGGNNGHNGNGRSAQPGAPMTQSQGRAIASIARRLGLDIDAECQDRFGCDLARLSLRQASEMIDHLKTLSPASKGGR